MRVLRDAPIRRKLEAIMLVTSAVVLSLSLVALLVLQLTSIREELEDRLQGLADVLGANSTAAMAFEDRSTASEILATLSTQPDVISATITRPDGDLFARYREQALGNIVGDSGLVEGGLFASSLAVKRPIVLDGELLGHIRLIGDMRRGYATLLHQSLLMFGVFVVSMLLAFMLSKRLQRIISVPVEQLLTAMNRVAATRSFTYRADRFGNDELGALVDGFNLMLGRLEENRLQLDAYQHRLEQLVQERTTDLEQRTRELNGVLSSVQDPVYILDTSGRFLFANQRLLDLLGLPWEQVIGACVTALACPKPFAEVLLTGVIQVAQTGAVVTNQATFRTAAGEARTFENILAPMPGGDSSVAFVAGSSRDISERIEAEKALMRRTAELERMNTELEEFAYIASHDLKAPLRAVANLSLVVVEDAGDRLDDENRRLLQLMRDRVTAMDALIDGLLRYARIGRAERHPSPIEWSPLLGELVESLSLPEGFRVEWEPSMPTMVADPLELRQVLQNLIANAANHHDRPQQGHAWIRAVDCGDHWSLVVADDGPGIPEHMRSEVFRMFSTGGAPGHTGIGLAVVRKIVLANGGRIEVNGNSPRGAVFRIEWPKIR